MMDFVFCHCILLTASNRLMLDWHRTRPGNIGLEQANRWGIRVIKLMFSNFPVMTYFILQLFKMAVDP